MASTKTALMTAAAATLATVKTMTAVAADTVEPSRSHTLDIMLGLAVVGLIVFFLKNKGII